MNKRWAHCFCSVPTKGRGRLAASKEKGQDCMDRLREAAYVQEEDPQIGAEQLHCWEADLCKKEKQKERSVTLSVREKQLIIRVIFQVQKSYLV